MKSNGISTKNLRKEEKDNGVEIHDTNKPLYEFSPGLAGHEWRQQGPYLICQSCEIKHATAIGMNKLLVGISEDGKAILNER